MKSKLKTIIITFVATTLFWCLVVVCTIWLFRDNSGVSFTEDAMGRGFVAIMSARNTEPQAVTFTVAELRTNTASANAQETVLLERQLPPAEEFWIGIKKGPTGVK